jgi:membrane protein
MDRIPTAAWTILKRTYGEFQQDDCLQMAAALAYYTIFSLPPLLVIIISIAGLQLGEEAVQGRVEQEIEQIIGAEAAEQVQTMISNASQSLSEEGSIWTGILGIGALLFGATGAFAQLQKALNRAWSVQPGRSGILNFLLKRALSFGMIVTTGFLLLVSLALSTLLTAIGSELQTWIPGFPLSLTKVLDVALSLTVITALFAAIFRILPDARINWRDVFTGAAVTALLFVAGKTLIGFYLGQSDPGSMFGAAGSLALVLLWIYLSAVLLLLGAEFTQVWARRHGKSIRPSSGAVSVVREIREDPS